MDFKCAPGVISNYFQRNSISLYPDSYDLITVTNKLETNVFRQMFTLKVFSTGNLSLGISHETSHSLNSMGLCSYTFNRTPGV